MSCEGLLVPHLLVASDTKEFLFFIGVESVFQLLQRLLHLAHSEAACLERNVKISQVVVIYRMSFKGRT